MMGLTISQLMHVPHVGDDLFIVGGLVKSFAGHEQPHIRKEVSQIALLQD
jgi:hypothetical protein